MPQQCCAVDCHHLSGRSGQCKLKRFPSDERRAKQWVHNIRRANWKRSRWDRLCECHFDDTQWNYGSRQDGSRSLKHDAVPRIFPTHVIAGPPKCHFDTTQFEQNRQDGARKLRHNAVPLIFPTHVLVVHDPAGEKKWLTPQPQPHPSHLNPLRTLRTFQSQKRRHRLLTPSQSLKKQPKIPKMVKKKLQTSNADHMYAKDSADEDSRGDSIMCDSFCPEDELDELEMNVPSPSTPNEIAQPVQNGSFGEKEQPDLSSESSISCRTRSRTSITSSKSPGSVSKLPEGQNKVRPSQPSTAAKFRRKLDSLRARESPQHSPPTPVNIHDEKQSSQYKPPDTPQDSIEILDIHSDADSETDFPTEQLDTPKAFDSEDLNGSTPEVLKDALSFLQFMLPQKWLAFSENSGIHVALISRSKAKSIQRSVFVPFNGGKIELYVHAKKLSRDHEIFENASFKEREPLTQDTLGSFVDRIVSIIQLFSSYEICGGVTDREYLLVWRKFTDCMLDCNSFGEEKYDQTVRSIACVLLAPKDGVRCKMCDTLYE